MPFISTKTNVSISKEQEKVLKTEFGKAISLIGKSEAWLMLSFDDNCKMYFKGSDEPCAIAEVKLYGRASSSAYDALTASLTKILANTLSVSPGIIIILSIKFRYCTILPEFYFALNNILLELYLLCIKISTKMFLLNFFKN